MSKDSRDKTQLKNVYQSKMSKDSRDKTQLKNMYQSKMSKDSKDKTQLKNMYRLDDVTKHRIIFLKEEGYTVTEIAESLGLTRKTVYLWWHRYESEGALKTRVSFGRPRKTCAYDDRKIVEKMQVQTRHRNTVYLWWHRYETEGVIKNHVSCGRPRKTCAYDDRKIVEKVQEGGRVTTSDLAQNFSVSASTIRRRLHDLGVQKTPVRKVILSPRHKTQRLNFAKKYLDYDFTNAIFIDVKTVNCLDGKISLGRKKKSRLNFNTIGHTMSFWGWISAGGTGHLIEVKSRLTANDYIGILQDVMVPTATAVTQSLPLQFVQDGAASFRSRFVREWIKKQENLVEIALPPKSPDLNPVQDVWDRIVRGWDNEKVKDFTTLKQHVMELWDSHRGTELCMGLVSSMRQRLQNIIDAEGDYKPLL